MNIVIGIFAIAISLGCFWLSFKFINVYFKVKAWIKIEANILSKEVKLHEKYSTSRSPYAVNVEYLYIYNNIEFKNNKVYLAEMLGGQVNHMQQTANKKLAEIKEKMSIYVNPKNPQQSVLFCEGIGLYFIVVIIGLFALIYGFTSLAGSN
jgi:hypothetical protein